MSDEHEIIDIENDVELINQQAEIAEESLKDEQQNIVQEEQEEPEQEVDKIKTEPRIIEEEDEVIEVVDEDYVQDEVIEDEDEDEDEPIADNIDELLEDYNFDEAEDYNEVSAEDEASVRLQKMEAEIERLKAEKNQSEMVENPTVGLSDDQFQEILDSGDATKIREAIRIEQQIQMEQALNEQNQLINQRAQFTNGRRQAWDKSKNQYPELNDPNSDLYQRTLQIVKSNPDLDAIDPAWHSKAATLAYAELLPKKFSNFRKEAQKIAKQNRKIVGRAKIESPSSPSKRKPTVKLTKEENEGRVYDPVEGKTMTAKEFAHWKNTNVIGT